MKLSATVTNTATTWRGTHQDLYAFLRGITVEFNGQTPEARPSTFTASGVVVKATATDAYIVTVKHNLSLATGGEHVDPATNFTSRIKARLYGVNDARLVEAAVAEVYLPPNQLLNNGLDCAVVRVRHAGFVQQVRGLVADGAVGQAFRPADFATSGWIMPLADAWTAQATLLNGRAYGADPVAAYQNYRLVQMGYGIYQAALYGFRYRVLAAENLVGATLLATTHEGLTDVFTFATNDENTGAPGDSGGPIFAIPAAGFEDNGIVLVAVHTGANYYADRTDNDDHSPTVNNAFTLAADAPMP